MSEKFTAAAVAKDFIAILVKDFEDSVKDSRPPNKFRITCEIDVWPSLKKALSKQKDLSGWHGRHYVRLKYEANPDNESNPYVVSVLVSFEKFRARRLINRLV